MGAGQDDRCDGMGNVMDTCGDFIIIGVGDAACVVILRDDGKEESRLPSPFAVVTVRCRDDGMQFAAGLRDGLSR